MRKLAKNTTHWNYSRKKKSKINGIMWRYDWIPWSLTYVVDVKALPFFTNCKGMGGGGAGRGVEVETQQQSVFSKPSMACSTLPSQTGSSIYPGVFNFGHWGWGEGGGGWLSSCLSAWRRETTTVTVGMWASRSSDPNGAWRRCFWVEKNICFSAMSQFLFMHMTLICSKTPRQSLWWFCAFPCKS